MTEKLYKIRSLSKKGWVRVKENPRKSTLALAVVILLAGFALFGGAEDETVTRAEPTTPSVTVTSVGTLSAETEPLVLLGEVRSVSQAELRAQKSGDVTKVYVKAGQFVRAGAILVEVSNQSERAMVLSAQGALAAAEAELDKTNAGARVEDRASSVVQTDAARVTLQSTQDSARNAYSQAYSQAQEAVFAGVDEFFSNPYSAKPTFRVNTASYNEKLLLENERVRIGEILSEWKQTTLTTIPNDELLQYLREAETDLERIKVFLSQVSAYVSRQELSQYVTPASKAAQEAQVSRARGSIDTARTTLTGARSALANALSSATVTQLSETAITTGARSEDIRVSEARVTQARGSLANAYASLENTLVRTPISGTVSTLNANLGDFLSPSEVVAVVANEGALEIEAFVSDVARSRITVGMPAKINGTLDGTVTSVSPGLDPVTKKSRITVGITGEANLANGSFVEVALQDQESSTDVALATTTASSEIRIPISAIKVLPRGFAVFIVSSEGVLQAQPIKEGPIVGSKMIIPEGLTPDMRIVTDVRGLSEGDVVTIRQEQN